MTHDASPASTCHVTPLRLHGRGRLRDFGQRQARRRGGGAPARPCRRQADRPRRARLAAARGRALPLRPRHRRDDDADRGATSLVDPEAAARGRRLSGRGAHPGRACRRRPRARVGILPEGRAPAREGAEIRTPDGTPIGKVTSGGFGPTLNGPLAMGYVNRRFAEPGTPVVLVVRGKPLVAKVAPLPFVPHRYHR